MRGRSKVLSYLVGHHITTPPTSYEIRDDQIYRWLAG
jgi:hypothetical protein